MSKVSSKVGTAHQFAERKAEWRRKRMRRIGLGIVASILAVFVAWVVWFSSWLTAETIQVEGQQRLSAAQIRKAADVPTSTPLARIDISVITANVKQIPAVAEVEVSRSWPRSVTISVTERSAVAWMRDGQQLRAVDRYGVAFRRYKRAPNQLPQVRVSGVGERRTASLQAASGVAETLRKRKPAWAKQVSLITAESKDSVALTLRDKRVIAWGSARLAERKLQVLRSLLSIKAARYDVSAPDQPTTRG